MKTHNDIIQKSDEWLHIRKGKITGTTLAALMSSRADTREGAIFELIAERLTLGVDSDGEYENPMARGNRLEPDARVRFEFETGLKVQTTGFVENDENSLIGYSPDGLILGNEGEDIEIKCPEGKAHVQVWLTNEVPDKYKWQMIHAFVVNPNLQKRYFVSYNPDIPVHPIHIIEVKREDIASDIEKAKVAQELALEKIENYLSTIIKL